MPSRFYSVVGIRTGRYLGWSGQKFISQRRVEQGERMLPIVFALVPTIAGTGTFLEI